MPHRPKVEDPDFRLHPPSGGSNVQPPTIIDEKQHAHVLGATDYLVKPVDRARLIEALRRVCPAAAGSVLRSGVIIDPRVVARLLAATAAELCVRQDICAAIRQLVLEGPFIPPPIAMLLYCPACGTQHVDEDEWAMRPHRTHLCLSCGRQWQPARVYTYGVLELIE